MKVKFKDNSEAPMVNCADSKTAINKLSMYSFDHSRTKHHWAEIIAKCDVAVIDNEVYWQLKNGETLE